MKAYASHDDVNGIWLCSTFTEADRLGWNVTEVDNALRFVHDLDKPVRFTPDDQDYRVIDAIIRRQHNF